MAHSYDNIDSLGDRPWQLAAGVSAQSRLSGLEQRLKPAMLSAVSHELRTPLTAIIGLGELLEDETSGPLTPQQREFVQMLQAAGARLAGLVDDMLDVAQLEAGTLEVLPQPGDLAGLLAEVIGDMGPQAAAAGLSLSLEPLDSPLLVVYDAPHVRRVLCHLLVNAFKFTPSGGAVRVGATVVQDAVRVEVRDTGIGIPPESLPALFDYFYQVDASHTRPQGGAGLGLPLCRGVVRAHGGQMEVASTPGEGSCFAFTLPRPCEKAGVETRPYN